MPKLNEILFKRVKVYFESLFTRAVAVSFFGQLTRVHFIEPLVSVEICCMAPPNCDSESHSVVSDSLRPHALYSPWKSPGQNTGMGSLSLLRGIFPTQGSHPSLPHCRWILYQLSHKGRPRILEWVAYPFSRGSSRYRDRTRVSCIASRLSRQKS